MKVALIVVMAVVTTVSLMMIAALIMILASRKEMERSEWCIEMILATFIVMGLFLNMIISAVI